MLNLTGSKISLGKKWKISLPVLLLITLLIVGVLTIFLLAFTLRKIPKQPEPSEIAPPTESIEEILPPGEIGEAPKGGTPAGTPENPETGPEIVGLPPVIFNTAGKIIGIQNDKLIVEGSGSNFSDQKPRELTLILTSATITFEPGQKTKYQGLEGLKHLRAGQSIDISSSENIRGKIQFVVDYINKL